MTNEDDYKAAIAIAQAGQTVRYCSFQEAKQFWAMFKQAKAEYDRLSNQAQQSFAPLKIAAE